jgi:hypothetical protein
MSTAMIAITTRSSTSVKPRRCPPMIGPDVPELGHARSAARIMTSFLMNPV